MALELDPSELGFKRPYTQEVSQTLLLRNPHSETIAFKVKTTAPKQYCVRPNSGSIYPGDQVEIKVILQPMPQDPSPDAKCKDKFLVQSVRVPPGTDTPTWNQLEQNYKSAIQERKIRVHYLPAEGSEPTVNGHGDDDHDESTMIGQAPAFVAAHTGEGQSQADPKEFSNTTPSSTNKSSLTTRDELVERLADANATIAKLKKEAEDVARKVKDEATSSSPAFLSNPQIHQQQGLSVQTAAILCLLTFIITWLLF